MINGMTLLAGLVSLTLTTSSAQAQLDAAELRCGALGGSTEQVERCLQQALNEAEKVLAGAQAELEQTLRDVQPHFAQLKDAAMRAIEQAMQRAQQTWREFLDRNCGYYGQLHRAIGEGSMEQLSCQLRMTKARTAELQEEAKFWREKATGMRHSE
jgi:uncharacterized protein YecT (DUF1311 family)